MQGNDKMERNYNYSTEKKYSFNNKIITDFEKMTAIHQMHYSEQATVSDKKSPPLTINDNTFLPRRRCLIRNRRGRNFLFMIQNRS